MSRKIEERLLDAAAIAEFDVRVTRAVVDAAKLIAILRQLLEPASYHCDQCEYVAAGHIAVEALELIKKADGAQQSK